MLLSKLAEGFLLDCQARNLSPKTIELYTAILEEFTTFLEDPDAQTVTAGDLRRFIVYEQDRNRYAGTDHPVFTEQPGRKLSAWTIHRYTRSLRTFFRWAVREEILESDPSAKLRRPKLPKDQVETFTQAQINTLLEQAQATSYRDYCIVFLALDSGLRKRELIALTLEDVNVLTGMVTVRHGKGDKYRQVRVGELCRKVLWRYVNQYRKPDDKAETVFFLSERGTPLSYYTLGTVMTRLSQKCGFRVTCHKCRHTFATNLARKFPNAFLIAQVLGHADLETSKGYIHLAAADVSAVFSPMDDLLGPK